VRATRHSAISVGTVTAISWLSMPSTTTVNAVRPTSAFCAVLHRPSSMMAPTSRGLDGAHVTVGVSIALMPTTMGETCTSCQGEYRPKYR
jgi:hypothetical protein